MHNGVGTLKDSLVGSYKNIFITYYPAIVLLDIDPNEFRTCVHAKTCAQVFSTLFLTDKAWKQPICPSIGKWINKLWHIHIMEYYSVLKGMRYQVTKRLGGPLNAYC